MDRIREMMRGQKPAVGAHLSILNGRLVEQLSQLGFDWLFLDAQRTPLDPERCVELVRVAQRVQMATIVRVPELNVTVIERYLDIGVDGILVADVRSVADARTIVDVARSACVGVLIESAEGADNLARIAAVAGVDVLAVGPNDLGVSLGTRDGIADPRVRAIVDRCVQEIMKSGKAWMTVVGDVEKAKEACAVGAALIAIPDVALLASSARDYFRVLR